MCTWSAAKTIEAAIPKQAAPTLENSWQCYTEPEGRVHLQRPQPVAVCPFTHSLVLEGEGASPGLEAAFWGSAPGSRQAHMQI